MPKRKKKSEVSTDSNTSDAKPSKPSLFILDVYLRMSGRKPGHFAGLKAYATTKHGVTNRTAKTEKEWGALFASY